MNTVISIGRQLVEHLVHCIEGFPSGEIHTSSFSDLPSVDISETDKEYLIRAALPAVKKEDVKVTYEDGMLTLSGERRKKEQEKGEKFHRVESFYGNFSRCFELPNTIDAEAISAEAKDGVLTVHVPKTKAEAKKLAKITVQ